MAFGCRQYCRKIESVSQHFVLDKNNRKNLLNMSSSRLARIMILRLYPKKNSVQLTEERINRWDVDKRNLTSRLTASMC